MDPLNPASFNHKSATVNGIRMHYVDEGTGPKTIICVHGFPDLWYGWRYQIPHLVSLGYRVIVPDVRGYGQTDAPGKVAGYTAKSVVTDLVSLLDVIGVHKAVWAGHDWGGFHVWRAAMWYPERVTGVISFCTPYVATRSEKVPLDEVVKASPNWTYQLYFRRQETINDLNEEIPLFLTALFRKHDELVMSSVFSQTLPIDQRTITDVRGVQRSSLLSEAELQYYISEYKRHGMGGPTNYYRVWEMNWQEEHDAGFLNTKINKPSMMVTVDKDRALPAEMTKGMEDYIPGLMRAHIQGSGHWVLAEQKDQANAALTQYLKALEAKDSKL
ncbi:hypothetical protein GGI12_000975 [Dipsacomyces acuminosporus]|nr:hypothetical protein GGI12_000975 [Dipsacomyces acuminosporus]